jgi:hypothetical protein
VSKGQVNRGATKSAGADIGHDFAALTVTGDGPNTCTASSGDSVAKSRGNCEGSAAPA